MKFKSLSVSVAVGAILIAALLAQTACKSTTFISTLNAVVAAADAAVASLETAGTITPAQSVLVVKYLDAVTMASGIAATELASSDTAAEKSRKIAEAFAFAVVPNVLGLPPVLSSWLKAVDVAVEAFLVNFHPGALQAHAAGSAPKPSMSQKHELASIRKHAERLRAQLAKVQ